jgi:hypothetical protein
VLSWGGREEETVGRQSEVYLDGFRVETGEEKEGQRRFGWGTEGSDLMHRFNYLSVADGGARRHTAQWHAGERLRLGLKLEIGDGGHRAEWAG